MGDKLRTIQNLEIIKSDLENNLIFLKGSVPGSKNSIVFINQAAKKIKKTTILEKIKNSSVQAIEKKAKPPRPDKKTKDTPKKETVKKPENKERKK